MTPEWHYYLLQVVTSPNNDPVHNRHSGYLKLPFISTCVSYIFNILLVIFSLYLLATTREYNRWNYHHHTIICHNTWSRKVACCTIQGFATKKLLLYQYCLSSNSNTLGYLLNQRGTCFKRIKFQMVTIKNMYICMSELFRCTYLGVL